MVEPPVVEPEARPLAFVPPSVTEWLQNRG